MFGSYGLAVGRGEHRHALGVRARELALPIRIETSELLLVGTGRVTCLCDGDAILIGQAFDRMGKPLRTLPGTLAHPASDPAEALRDQWGNYALFFASPDRFLAYREPSASVPVYRCGGEGQTIFVSDAEIAAGLGLLEQPEIDRTFLLHWLQFPFLRTERTGLKGVTELQPGMALERSCTARWSERAVWHPSMFVQAGTAMGDPFDAARLVRQTASTIVAAQIPEAPIALRLSGGLDSSIIAACLAGAGRSFQCINFATRSADGDERDYARDVADRLGLQLVELSEPSNASLELPCRRSFRPLVNPLLEPFERVMAQAADPLGASLLIDGGGGDNLFCSLTSAAPVLDALASGSLGKAATAVTDIAARAECTLWDVLTAAGRRLVKRRRLWKEDRSFLVPTATLTACEPHPWLCNLHCPPGKREHVEALVHIQHFLDRTSSSKELLHPLLAQPLLELCLRIPSWLWVSGGRDRAIARDAFEPLLPSSVVRRRSKGSLQGMLYRSFAALRVEMRELLLGGELACRGIIDLEAIKRALEGDEWMNDMVQLRISEMVALELWLRSWRSGSSSVS